MAVFKAKKADDMKQVTDSQNVMKVMKDRAGIIPSEGGKNSC